MQIRNIIFGMILLMITTVFSQSKLNAYKYIIAPKQFDFQKYHDSYQINSLTKFLFEKQGFVVLYSDESFPVELKENPCLALNVKLIDHSNMLKTKLVLELKNCLNQIVLQSPEAISREKELKKGFHEAIRKAFETVENEGYSFTPKAILKERQEVTEKVAVAADQKPIPEEAVVADEIIIEKPMLTEPKYQEKVPVIAEIPKIKSSFSVEGVFQSDTQTLSIQKQGNQFVVSDGKNNVIGILYPTSQANYFIIKWLQNDDNQPKLTFLNQEGHLLIDDTATVIVFKRKSL
ncbi:MAG: hypothetical protein Q8J84_02420 [Flavobacteriaceae bacterium]|nr:hypothetical protein [Flavobacteriaceae bacterium]